MSEILYPELSYRITGLCFRAHRELGRFCRERQYADRLEELLLESMVPYQREIELQTIASESPRGNRADFLISGIVVDLKAKPFITKDDYMQMQRYLRALHVKLGLIVNFRSISLKPKRVINSTGGSFTNSYHSHVDSHHSHRSQGFVTLLAVLVVSVVTTAIAVSLLLIGVSFSRTGFALERSYQAHTLADACAEEGLQQIRNSTPFTGSGSLTLGQGTCSYTVTSQGGHNRTITASGTIGSTVRKVRIVIDQINPTINLTSWQEVADL